MFFIHHAYLIMGCCLKHYCIFLSYTPVTDIITGNRLSVPEYSVNITGIYSSLPEWYFGKCRHYQNTLCLLSECYLISISIVDIFIFISKTYSLMKFVLIVDIMYFSEQIHFCSWVTHLFRAIGKRLCTIGCPCNWHCRNSMCVM